MNFKKKVKKGLDFLVDFVFWFFLFFRKSVLLFFLFIFLFILFSNLFILFNSKNRIFYEYNKLPEIKTALVLGTSKYVSDNPGLINLFYDERIKTANKLYDSGKIQFLILSGTNNSKYYNEPESMKKDLMSLGVPEDKIFLDYAGFRTLDSVIRSKEIFSQNKILIVSQKFHIQRALAIASLYGIDAYGFVAPDPPLKISLKAYFREILSRIKLLYDILFRVGPKFYGEKIEIK